MYELEFFKIFGPKVDASYTMTFGLTFNTADSKCATDFIGQGRSFRQNRLSQSQ